MAYTVCGKLVACRDTVIQISEWFSYDYATDGDLSRWCGVFGCEGSSFALCPRFSYCMGLRDFGLVLLQVGVHKLVDAKRQLESLLLFIVAADNIERSGGDVWVWFSIAAALALDMPARGQTVK